MEIVDLKSENRGPAIPRSPRGPGRAGRSAAAPGTPRGWRWPSAIRPEELAGLPEGTNLGLSCGNPQSLASLELGPDGLDLGSGAGFDALLAARKVGPDGPGRRRGHDRRMLARQAPTPRRPGWITSSSARGTSSPCRSRTGRSTRPLSNCVLNLVGDKDRAFREIHRVLRPGGRLSVSDMAWAVEPDPGVRRDLEAIVGCPRWGLGPR